MLGNRGVGTEVHGRLKARNNVTSQAVVWAPSPDLCGAHQGTRGGPLPRREAPDNPLLTVGTEGAAILEMKLHQADVQHKEAPTCWIGLIQHRCRRNPSSRVPRKQTHTTDLKAASLPPRPSVSFHWKGIS